MVGDSDLGSSRVKQKTFLIIGLILTLSVSTMLLIKSKSSNSKSKLATSLPKNSMTTTTRQAQVAGQFYPAQTEQLQATVSAYLASAAETESPSSLKNQSPRIVIAPHAGYPYSGAVAAQAIARLDPQQTSRVFLLGSSHHHHLTQVSLANQDNWQTPLGKVELDQFVIKQLSTKDNWEINNQAHDREHSLEVELPLLQEQLSQFKLVPMLVGQLQPAQLPDITKDLATVFDENSVLVISSDLSHYPDYELAQEVDQELLAAIVDQDLGRFTELAAQTKPGQNLQTRACGQQAIEIGLLLADIIGAHQTQLYQYQNSGDVTGDHSQVVGYGAVGFYDTKRDVVSSKDQNSNLGSDFAQQAVEWAKQCLVAAVNDQPPATMDFSDSRFQEQLGVFVTLHQQQQLRGCMGLIESDLPLWQGVKKMAKAAALEDPRFPKVASSELDDIEIEVSVLTKPKLINDPDTIQVGKDGVIISHSGRRGVFLPQVATEQDYNREQFLNNLCSHKLGLDQSCWRDPAAKIYTFQADVYSE